MPVLRMSAEAVLNVFPGKSSRN